MELTSMTNLEIGRSVLLQNGPYKGKTFKKESRTIWVQLWTVDAPRQKTWMPKRITTLDIMAGMPEVLPLLKKSKK